MTTIQRLVIAAFLLLLVVVVAGVLMRELGGPSPTTATPTPRLATAIPTSTRGQSGLFSPTLAAPRQGAAETGAGTVGIIIEPDDGRKPILDELNGAKQSITLEVYLLSDKEIINALEDAQHRGVRVQVILDEHPYGGAGNQPQIFKQLQDAGVAVRWSNPAFRFTHIKTFVIDQKIAIIMSMNLTRSSFTNNRELGVITTRPAEVQQAAAIFAADWNRGPEPPAGLLVVSPANSRSVLLGLINGASRSIDIYAEEMQDPQIIKALVAAEDRGVTVRLIMSKQSGNDTNAAGRAQLEQAGADVRIAKGNYIHAKMLLVDGQQAFIGSENISAASLDFNRELGIIVDRPANLERISSVFVADFANGKKEAA